MRPAKGLRVLTSVGIAAVLWTSVAAHAGSARDYLNAPVYTWLLNYNAGYTTSLTPEDGADLIPGVRANVLAQSVVLTRIMDYWGRTGGFSLVLPYALIDTSAGPFRASTNGVSDVGFLWQMNIFGGPALTREQFQSFIPQTFSSFHLLVTTPLGFYQPSSPINPSANRWMISPIVNFSYTPDQGWTWIETYVSGRIFTDNGNYLVNGAQTLTQRPLLRLEEHLSRNVTDALWLSADAYISGRDEHRWDRPGQHGEYASDRSGNGASSLARRQYGAELRARRRQARERALFANRAIDSEAALVGVHPVIDERPPFAHSGRRLALGGRRLSPRSDGELPDRASSEGTSLRSAGLHRFQPSAGGGLASGQATGLKEEKRSVERTMRPELSTPRVRVC